MTNKLKLILAIFIPSVESPEGYKQTPKARKNIATARAHPQGRGRK